MQYCCIEMTSQGKKEIKSKICHTVELKAYHAHFYLLIYVRKNVE